MPEENYPFYHKEELLSPNEIYQLAKTFVQLGINKIRLTGGEPLLRKDFSIILNQLSTLGVELGITTNGVLLDKYFQQLQNANIRILNISIDSLKSDSFAEITGRNQFERVWNNILQAHEMGFHIKLNVVAIKGKIEVELSDFLKLIQDYPFDIRFIEFMPFTGNHWSNEQVITMQELQHLVQSQVQLNPLPLKPHHTAKEFTAEGFLGTMAFISTMSNHFCSDCNRLRITAEGKIKNCLFGKDEFDLITPLRKGESIDSLIAHAVKLKHRELGGQLNPNFNEIDAQSIVNRSMIGIGG